MDNISTQLTQLQTIKQNIATAIEGKGGTVGTGFDTYATAISNLPDSSGGGTPQIRLSESNIRFGNSTFSSIPEWVIVDTLPDYVFNSCQLLTSVTIPNSITSIGQNAFAGCNRLATVSGGNNVTSIGQYAFRGTAISSVPCSGNSLTSIGNNAFHGCLSLTSATIPSSVTSIGNYAFQDCGYIASVTFNNCPCSIGNNVFYNCGRLTSVDLGNAITSIGTYAFQGTKITAVNIPSTVTSIGSYAFYNIGTLTSITLPAVPNLFGTSLAGNVAQFRQSGMTTINIPGAIGIIPKDCFCMCKQCTSLTIGEGITQIGQGAFYNMEGLTELTIPSTVTTIATDAFFACINLNKLIILPVTPPTLSNDAFQASLTYPMYVPDESVDNYKAASNWLKYSSRIKPMSDLATDFPNS